MFQDISSILAIAAATWAGWEAYRANQRLEEEGKPIFRTYFLGDKTEQNRIVQLSILNQEKNSIFIDELQPINFNSIIPQSGASVNEVGFWVTHFGEPAKTYRIASEEIISDKWRDFNFKIPSHVKRIKLKVHYSVMTSGGLKKTSCIYDYIIPSDYFSDSSPPQD